ncbi:hypothetical protein JMJ77_0011577, partial [Colletotrichum scovillei]
MPRPIMNQAAALGPLLADIDLIQGNRDCISGRTSVDLKFCMVGSLT